MWPMGVNRSNAPGNGATLFSNRHGGSGPSLMQSIFRPLIVPLCIAVHCIAFQAEVSAAAPEPALVPRTWQLEFNYDPPRPIAVADKTGKIHWFWFITYKVVNHTETDRIFLPSVTIATDSGDIIRTNPNVPMAVFEAIKERTNIALLEHPVKIDGAIKPGEDRARESIAVWRAFDHDVDTLSIFFGGLSGDSAKVLDPRTRKPVMDPQSLKPQVDPITGEPIIDPETGKPKINPRPLLLRKTLEMRYHMPGSHLHPQHQPMVPREKRWVMR